MPHAMPQRHRGACSWEFLKMTGEILYPFPATGFRKKTSWIRHDSLAVPPGGAILLPEEGCAGGYGSTRRKPGALRRCRCQRLRPGVSLTVPLFPNTPCAIAGPGGRVPRCRYIQPVRIVPAPKRPGGTGRAAAHRGA